MGTSQSSGGPGPGVPMVPPWTPPAPPPEPPAPEPAAPEQSPPAPPAGDDPPVAPASPNPMVPLFQPALAAPALAPAGRFRGTRRSLGDYARSGNRDDLKRALGHYVRSGYSGSATAAARLGGTATTAQSLGSALSNVAHGQPAAGSPLDPALLAGRSIQEVMDAVVEAVRPTDGTQDAEAARAAIRDALSELLTQYPEADLLNLDSDQREFVIERYAAIDVFRRFELDVGVAINEKSPTATVALARLKDARDYVKEIVGAEFRKLRDVGNRLTVNRINRVVSEAVRETCIVFEGYAE